MSLQLSAAGLPAVPAGASARGGASEPTAGSAASARRTARGYLRRIAPRYGLDEAGTKLAVRSAERPGAPGFVVRLQQRYRGIPVLGGELALRLDRRERLLSLSGELERRIELRTRPRLARLRAASLARDRVAAANGIDPAAVEAGAPRLSIYEPRLLGVPGPARPLLVWKVEAGPTATPERRELVLVDGRDGRVRLTIPAVAHAGGERMICDAREAFLARCDAPYARVEGEGPTGITDVDEVYDNLGLAREFYSSRFGRDSFDGQGAEIVATARLCDKGGCPFENASYDFRDRQFRVGQGWGVADVMGHEFTHGVTDSTSRLYYLDQSGGINESMSDIFGELIEPAAERDWLWGEDLPPGQGPIRSLADPPAVGDPGSPDRMRSRLWGKVPDVHFYSGVGNKAGYLIIHGGSFRGEDITGLGADKGAAVYYEAQVAVLTSGSNYRALAFALPQACRNLRGGPEGITAGDCLQVRRAVAATQMRRRPQNVPPGVAPTCRGRDLRPDTSFYDDLEDPGLGLWRTSSRARKDGFRYPQPASETRATSGVTNFYADLGDRETRYRAHVGMTRPVRIPREGLLHFNHGYHFGSDRDDRWLDGGIVEYRRAGARRWRDARRLFDGHGYTGRIRPGRDNPLALKRGRRAFVGSSQGYISSRVDLSTLAGERLRFRFTYGVGRGHLVPSLDWFIDDIHIYRCVGR